jgi:hypothetical protein
VAVFAVWNASPERHSSVDEEFVPDSPLEEDGFELLVPRLRLLEVSANHVFEIFDADYCVRVEGIWIIYRDKPACHVPFVPKCLLVGLANIVWGLILLSEVADISLRIRIPDGFVRKVAQRLMVTNRPTDFLIHVKRGSHRTRCWSKQDSNPRSPNTSEAARTAMLTGR